jgi:hypothetical protein
MASSAQTAGAVDFVLGIRLGITVPRHPSSFGFHILPRRGSASVQATRPRPPYSGTTRQSGITSASAFLDQLRGTSCAAVGERRAELTLEGDDCSTTIDLGAMRPTSASWVVQEKNGFEPSSTPGQPA